MDTDRTDRDPCDGRETNTCDNCGVLLDESVRGIGGRLVCGACYDRLMLRLVDPGSCQGALTG